MSPLDAFDRILASLYQALLDDAHWPAASALIDEACGLVGNALIVGEGLDDVQIHFARYLYRGEPRPDVVREYFEVYHPQDEGLPRLRRLPDAKLVHIPELYTEKERRTSAAYNEGLHRLHGQNGLGVRLDGPDGLRIVWGLGDPVAAGAWQSAQIELIERLVPHVRQFVRIRQAMAAADALSAGLEGLLEHGRIGVIHLGRGGRVLAANAAALDILRRGDVLFDRDGFLGVWLPKEHDRLQRLLKRALPALSGAAPAAGSTTLGRPSSPVRLGLHVTPVGDAHTDFGARRVAALVLLVDPANRPAIDPHRVAAALGLTPAESRVSALLAEGLSTRAIIDTTGYRESYVRWLLKQAYRKQGVSGQVALARLVLAADALPRR